MKKLSLFLLFAIFFVSGKCQVELVIQSAHEKPVTFISDSEDGKLILTGDGITCKIWEGKNGQLIKTIDAKYIAFTNRKNKIISFEKYAADQTLVKLINMNSFAVEKEVLLKGPFENMIRCKDTSTVLIYGGRSNFNEYYHHLLDLNTLEIKLAFSAYDVRLDYEKNMLAVVNYIRKENGYTCSYMNFNGEKVWNTGIPDKYINCCSDQPLFEVIDGFVTFNENEKLWLRRTEDGKTAGSSSVPYFSIFKKIKWSSRCGHAQAQNKHFLYNEYQFTYADPSGNIFYSNEKETWLNDKQEPAGDFYGLEKIVADGTTLFGTDERQRLYKLELTEKKLSLVNTSVFSFHTNKKQNRFYIGNENGTFTVFSYDMSKIILSANISKEKFRKVKQAALDKTNLYIFQEGDKSDGGKNLKLNLANLRLDNVARISSDQDPCVLFNRKNEQLIISSMKDEIIIARKGIDTVINGTLVCVDTALTKLLVKGKAAWFILNLNEFSSVNLEIPLPNYYEHYRGSFSPDGKNIVIYQNYSAYYVYNTESKAIKKIEAENRDFQEAQWSGTGEFFMIRWESEIESLKETPKRKTIIYNSAGEQQSTFDRWLYWPGKGKYLLFHEKNDVVCMTPDGKKELGRIRREAKTFTFESGDDHLFITENDSMILHKLPDFKRTSLALKSNAFDYLFANKRKISINGKTLNVHAGDNSLEYFNDGDLQPVKKIRIPYGSWTSAAICEDKYLLLFDNIYDGGFLKVNNTDFTVKKYGSGETPLFSSVDLSNTLRGEFGNSRKHQRKNDYVWPVELLKEGIVGRSENVDPATFRKDRLLTIDDAGILRIYDLHTDSLLFRVMADDNGFIIVNAKGYYAKSAELKDLRFSSGNSVFSFEQFDLKYNRPDIILKELGAGNEETISSFYGAYMKRLKRMGFTEDMLKEDFEIPEVQISNYESLSSHTDSAFIDVDLLLRDEKYTLDRINVYINDVPVYGTAGIDIRKDNCRELRKTLHLELAEGKNKVQISVLNQTGAESFKETFYTTRSKLNTGKHDLYLITIGAGEYADKRYNLNYAAKDAMDINSLFSTDTTFGKVFSFVLTDENVTLKNVQALKSKLAKAKRDDLVIIAVAGHGVLDKNYNYYLASYDMNFNAPEKNGIPYEEIENLVDGIAPVKKIILLDACHSGEVDKEEVSQIAVAATVNTEIKFRNAGAGIAPKTLGLKTTSELMRELFTDLRRGTGATVISSAGGFEFAIESDQWKNGLFTFCLLNGLKNKTADSNKDGQIMLSELQEYLRVNVKNLSNGAQQPTSRNLNLSMDYPVWR